MLDSRCVGFGSFLLENCVKAEFKEASFRCLLFAVPFFSSGCDLVLVQNSSFYEGS